MARHGGGARRCCVAFLAVVLLGLAQCRPQPWERRSNHPKEEAALFSFGDSQVDVGNNNFLDTPFKANFVPYGITHLNASGRFSNGYLQPDYLAKYLRICLPGPSLAYAGGSIKTGLNFASAGSGILNSTNEGKCLSLESQLQDFLALVASGNISDKVASRAVYYINTGGNDVLTFSGNQSAVPELISSVVQGFTGFIQALYDAGARNFIVPNLPPLGCIPYVRANLGGSPPLGCNGALNNLSAALNGAIEAALTSPSFVFNGSSGAKLVTYDQYSTFFDIVENLTRYGFNSTDACCGGPGELNGLVLCGLSSNINGTNVEYVLCPDIESHVFWDVIHGTERIAQIAAKNIWKGSDFTSPEEGAEKYFQLRRG